MVLGPKSKLNTRPIKKRRNKPETKELEKEPEESQRERERVCEWRD